MVLVDKGNGNNVEFGHTDYKTGAGRGVTRSENQKEWYVNPELTVNERKRISVRDGKRRNRYAICLLNETCAGYNRVGKGGKRYGKSYINPRGLCTNYAGIQ